MNARGLQAIRLADGRVVLKRGAREVVVSGERPESLVEPLLSLLDGTRTAEEVVAEFPGPRRRNVEYLLRTLGEGGLLTDVRVDGRDGAFYASFGASAAAVPELLRTASAVVVGVNLVARSLVRSLLEVGLGRVVLVSHPILDDEEASRAWLDEPVVSGERLELAAEMPALDGDDVSVLCATSDLGEAEALLELNRLALAAGTIFLPARVADMVGLVGPLTHPFETACLRCYRLRADSNDPRFDVAEAVRAHVTTDPEARRGATPLAPMAAVVGEIAAMEVVKLVGRFVPTDAVARLIEINLVSFRSAVRRVLKLPRCPDCSDVMRRTAVATMRGPQIPNRE